MVKTNGDNTLMLKVDGTVWGYGLNINGELGINNKKSVEESLPCEVVFPSEIVIKEISLGKKHALALDENGEVWAWGANENYVLGNTSMRESLVPFKINGLSGIKKIECGDYTSFAIGENGEIYSFRIQ